MPSPSPSPLPVPLSMPVPIAMPTAGAVHEYVHRYSPPPGMTGEDG